MYDDSEFYMTEAEHLESLASHFKCELQLALVIRQYYRSLATEHPDDRKHPKPGCCSIAHKHERAKERTYACISDYRGLIAIYRLRSDGRWVLLENWPRWLVENDRDPERRAHCRRLHVLQKRRDRRIEARSHRVATKLLAMIEAGKTLSNDSRKVQLGHYVVRWANPDMRELTEMFAELDALAA